jgi:rhomboid protease GluP
MPDDWDYSTKRPEQPPAPLITFGLCILCVLLTLARFFSDPASGTVWAKLGHFGSLSPEQIWNGGYYALLTSFFYHGDWMHLLFNMLWLVQLGRVMETSLHPLVYFLFLVSASAVSMGCELAVTGNSGIGASGVVYAMFGLMWVGRAKYSSWREIATQRNMNIFLMWGVFCLFGTWAKFMNVANVAHGSGLVFGLAVGWLFFAPRRKPIWGLPLALVVVLSALSLFWLPWSEAWNFYKGNKAFEREQYRSAVEWYHRSLRLGGDRYYAWENIRRAWHNIALQAYQRHDEKEALEALKQMDSAQALEGKEPSAETSDDSASPGFGSSLYQKRK